MRRLSTLATLGLITICSNSAWAAQCSIEGEYIRKDGSRLTVSVAAETLGDSIKARAQIQALGNIAPDGAPRYGNLEGELHLSRDYCTGVVEGELADCKFVLRFTGGIARVNEVGACFTGMGVSGDGDYARQKKSPPRKDERLPE